MPAYVTEAQVGALLTPADARIAVAGAFDRLARGAVDNPARVRAQLPDGVFAVMPCVDNELGYAGLKTYAWLSNGTPFLVVLISIERAEVTAVVEADVLGQRRTAAASAVAALALARADSTTLGVFGCGRQAASHVAALREALPRLERVLVAGRDDARVAAFCATHGCEPAATPPDAAACDVVVTATTATEPVLCGDWLRDGACVLAVGANEPDARELDDAVLRRADVVCTDSLDQARAESGDLIGAVAAGALAWSDVGLVHDGARRTSDDQITLFKSNGLAAWDLAAAARVVELV